jgi:predicted MFS family arabinose efflux permease
MKKEVRQPSFSRRELILLIILFSATFVVATGIQMGNALFPALSRLLDVPLGTVTTLVSVWAFTGLLAPLFGPPSDRCGHGLFVLIGFSTFTIGNLLCALAPGFTSLLVFQVLVGLGYAIYNFSASAIVGDLFAYAVRARAMSLVRIAVSVTALVGVPAAAAIAGWATARAPFGAIGGLGLVVLVLAWIWLPRTSREEKDSAPAEAEANLWGSVRQIARQRSALAGLFTFAIWAMIPTGIFVYLAAWLEDAFRLTEAQVGLAFALVGVGGLVGNALTAAWADRLGKKRSALWGLVALSAAAILLPHLTGLAAAFACIALLAVALEFSTASFSTLMTELAPESRGTLLSLASLAIGTGTGVAPLALRPLWESRGYELVTLTLGVVGLVLAVAAGILIAEPPGSAPDQTG